MLSRYINPRLVWKSVRVPQMVPIVTRLYSTGTGNINVSNIPMTSPGVLFIEDAPPGAPPAMIIGNSGEQAMILYQLAFQYGGEQFTQKVGAEISGFSYFIQNDANWELYVSSPFFMRNKQKYLFQVSEQLGISKFLTLWLANLLEEGQEDKIARISKDYNELLRCQRREAEVTLITKEELNEEDLEFYRKNIQLNYLKPQDNMIFSAKTDPSIIGGYKVVVRGNVHDETWNNEIEDSKERRREQDKQRMEAILKLIGKQPKMELKSKPNDDPISQEGIKLRQMWDDRDKARLDSFTKRVKEIMSHT